MAWGFKSEGNRTVISQDGVARVAINEDGSMELLTPAANPAGNKVPTAGQLPFTKPYESPEQTIVLGGALTLPHSLGTSPKLVQLWLRCVVADHGYSVGDLVQITNTADSIGSVAGIGWSVVPDATNINLRAGNVAFATLIIKNTGAGTTVNTVSNWRLIVRAWA